MATLALALAILTSCAAQIGLAAFCVYGLLLIRKSTLNVPSFERILIFVLYIGLLFAGWILAVYPGDAIVREFEIIDSLGHAGIYFFGPYITLGAMIFLLFSGIGIWVLIKPDNARAMQDFELLAHSMTTPELIAWRKDLRQALVDGPLGVEFTSTKSTDEALREYADNRAETEDKIAVLDLLIEERGAVAS